MRAVGQRVVRAVRRILAGMALLAGLSVVSGCSARCDNVAMDVNLSQPGAESPAAAIDAWSDEGTPGMPSPPDSGWEVPDEVDEESLTLVNPGEDWVVGVTRTDEGGWVVTSASTGCQETVG